MVKSLSCDSLLQL